MPIIYKYYPMFDFTNHKIIKSKYNYEKVIIKDINGIILDPIYEAKCVEFLEENDLFWIIGKRRL